MKDPTKHSKIQKIPRTNRFPSCLLMAYTFTIVVLCVWPRAQEITPLQEILPQTTLSIAPKSGDQVRFVGSPTVYQLRADTLFPYENATAYFEQGNPPFETAYEAGGILLCPADWKEQFVLGTEIKAAPQPLSVQVQTLNWSDKIGHAAVYWVWGFLAFGVLNRRGWELKKVIGGVLFFGTLLGILLEWAQYYFVEGRSYEVLDLCSNELGLFLGLCSGILVKNWLVR